MKMHAHRSSSLGRGFTLVELLVVIGIIGLLIALLLPSVRNGYRQAKQVQCQSNLRQIGYALTTYMNDNRGYVFPPKLGTNVPRQERWPVYVRMGPEPTDFELDHNRTQRIRAYPQGTWNPPIMTCPSDLEPPEEHSYVLNAHLAYKKIKYHTTDLGGMTPTDIVVMGEKVTSEPDYYMELNDFTRVVEPYRHGVKLGSNYLYLDLHVDIIPPNEAMSVLDPWDPPAPGTQPGD